MFLKSIDLLGFKSFADKSHIEFTDGISALIGPNGCGKSNVVDAIKWVLGEQASKSLRAERMEDVIFNGTDARKPVNVAEVTLTLENNGVLPLEMPEVSIKRRLFRSGESEYYINHMPVKLKDVRELFYDTGIGKTAYSIMEQGKIDQILSTKPEDRRSIFEEAAGITRFKMRGKEADRKLERTEANMHEVESVLTEVRRSYETLKKQAEKTAQYRTLREQLFNTEVALQLLRLTELNESAAVQSERFQTLEERRTATKREIDALNEKLESELDRISSRESRLVEVQKRLYGLELEKSSRADKIGMIKAQQSDLEEKIAREVERDQHLAGREAEFESARNAALASAAEIESEIADMDRLIADIEERIARAQERRTLNENAAHAAEQTVGTNEQRVVALQRELRSVTDELVTALDAKLRESGYSSAERARAEEVLLTALSQLRITIEGRGNALVDRARIEGASDAASLKKLFNDAMSAELEAFGTLERAFERYQTTIPRFLDDFLAPEGIITRKRQIDNEIDRLHQHNQELRTTVRELAAENKRLQQTVDEERANLEQMRVNRMQRKGRLETHRAAAERAERDTLELRRQRADLQRQIQRDRERIEEFGAAIADVHAEVARLVEEEQRFKSELRSLEEGIAADNQHLRAEEGRLKTLMQSLAEVQSSIEDLQVKLAEKRTEVRALYDGFIERHGRDLREFEARAQAEGDGSTGGTIDAKELRESLNALRAQLKELGNVNLMAVEEFAEVKERYEFLAGQLDDLKKAREDLARVTAEIRKESEQLFIETYNRIRKNFHTLFRRLFGGGRAELRLSDPEHVLDSGIDMLVQPPGKKLENIALLSGGERSLTAVALLFATFMVRPSPFCLLDEIDAALDEHNVGRFVTMLHEFAEQSQFIVITHNKKTVAGANTLLGVTMEESGISRVVAVRVEAKVDVEL